MTAKGLRLGTVLASMAALLVWWALGANSGWTKTTMPVQKTDPVTGIEYAEHQKRFLPGVDFLAVAAVATGIMFGGSFLFSRKRTA